MHQPWLNEICEGLEWHPLPPRSEGRLHLFSGTVVEFTDGERMLVGDLEEGDGINGNEGGRDYYDDAGWWRLAAGFPARELARYCKLRPSVPNPYRKQPPPRTWRVGLAGEPA